MLLWLAVGGVLASALGRWRLAEARHDRAVTAAAAARRARRRHRTAARIIQLEPTGATLLGMRAMRITIALPEPGDGGDPGELAFTRALPPAQLAWVRVGATLDTTYDPDDLANFATELEGRFAEETGARVHVLLDAPLWALGHDADAWLLPAPAADPPRVRCVPGSGADGLGATALAADTLALTTSARPRVALVVDPSTRAIAGDPDASAPLAATVSAPAAPGADATLQLRVPHGAAPPPVSAPLADLPAALVLALAEHALVTRVEPPGWYRVPRAEASAAYARVLPDLILQLLADPARAVLAPLPAETHAAIVDRAIAAAHAHEDGLLHLAALACAVAAARAGALTLEQRVYASELVGHYAGTGHPIDLLAPSYLVAFNLRLDARRRLRQLRGLAPAFRHAESAYQAWLARRFG